MPQPWKNTTIEEERPVLLYGDPKGGFRYTKVTPVRKKAGFAHFICDLVERHFPQAGFIQWGKDNLNTHFEGSLPETFDQEKTEHLMKKLRFIYPPKHSRNSHQHQGSTVRHDRVEGYTTDRIANQEFAKQCLIINLSGH